MLERDDYLTRIHTSMAPADMTADPYRVRDASAPDVDNHHILADDDGGDASGTGLSLLIAPLAVLALRRRRRAVGGALP